jgi:hypothetical protein
MITQRKQHRAGAQPSKTVFKWTSVRSLHWQCITEVWMANTEKIPIYPLTSDSFNLKKTDEFSFEIRIAFCPAISEKKSVCKWPSEEVKYRAQTESKHRAVAPVD